MIDKEAIRELRAALAKFAPLLRNETRDGFKKGRYCGTKFNTWIELQDIENARRLLKATLPNVKEAA